MKNKLLLLLALPILLSSTTCNRKAKDPCKTGTKVRVPQHAVDFFYFKEGSWWVYEDEVTKEQDSVWVCFSRKDTLSPAFLESTCDCLYDNCYENIQISLVSSKFNACRNDNGFLNYTIEKRGNDANDRVYEFKEFSGMNNNQGLHRFYWRQDGTLDSINGFNEHIRDTINVTIKGFTFNQCIKYVYEKGADWSDENIYAKNVGLVSYKLKGKNKWNIIKYHIEK